MIIKQRFSLIIFGFALFIAILLGDARQSVVDVFMAGAAMAGYFVLWKTGGLRTLPRTAVYLWAAVLIVGFPLFWPDALGAAVQSYIRYLFGFMVFGLAYTMSKRHADEFFESALLAVGAAVSVLATVFLFVARPAWLPPMNLLYPSYGHNHAADVLLFVVPILLYRKIAPFSAKIFFWTIILCGLVFSFARGAWLLTAVYAAGVCLVSYGQRRKTGAVLAVVFFAALIVIGVAATFHRKQVAPSGWSAPYAIERFINKGSIASDPRFEYWKQARLMIEERPFFGSGPGSFYYGSRRLQSHPGAFSWFTHSFPLQTLAEQGAVGALPVFFLFGWIIWRMIHYIAGKPLGQSALSRLASGALLATAYSFIEFNFSFAVVWAIFWAIAGMVIGDDEQEQQMKGGRQLYYPIVVLSIFYLLFIGQSIIFSFFPKRANVAFYLTPFDSATTQYYLSSGLATPHGINLANMFHKTDTETQQVIATAWKGLGQMESALDTRRKIMWLDPLIEDNHKTYLEILSQSGNYEEAAGWFTLYPGFFVPANADKKLVKSPVPPVFLKENTREIPKLFDAKHAHEVRYSRFYYVLGLWYLPTEPEKTRQLWDFASQLQPKLSYLWLERAALEERVFGDRQAAVEILTRCMNNPSAWEPCGHALSLPGLPQPGYYKQEINEK